MPHEHGAYLGGVRSVADLRARCRVDEITGCWCWAMSTLDGVPRVHVRLPDGTYKVMRGRRAAAVLSGRAIHRGYVAYAIDACNEPLCVNPAHVSVASREVHGQALSRNKRLPDRALRIARVSKLSQKRRLLTDEQVLEIRSSEEPVSELARRFGIDRRNIYGILQGRVYRNVGQPPAAPNSSVWTFRP